MKVCPTCQRTFDDSQNFCLNDGTPLVIAEIPSEPATVVTNRPPVPPSSQRIIEQPVVVQPLPTPTAQPTPPRKSNTGMIIALTALATLLLLGVIGGGLWMLSSRRDNRETARTNVNTNTRANVRTTPANTNAAANTATATNANRQATNSATTLPVNQTANNENTEAGEPAPTPAKDLTNKEVTGIRNEVSGVVNSWKSALESNNIDGHLSYYADSVDYYNGRHDRAQIRADKQRAFEMYDDIEMKVSNMRVTPDPSGERATVIYDKTWRFENDERGNEGSVQSQLVLQRIDGRWRIVGERDLKVYYTRSY